MQKNIPRVCLTLTSPTLSENVSLVKKYSAYIDLVELRVDYLNESEQNFVRRFPAMIPFPCILTIRRKNDGGNFYGNEMSRTILFSRALAFANQDRKKNFAYVDFEEEYQVPSLQEAALSFGTKIIRSVHDMKNPIKNLQARFSDMHAKPNEILKIACMPHTLSDITEMFAEAKTLHGFDYILCAMGNLGIPSRILAQKTNSFLTYTSPKETEENLSSVRHLDPETLETVFHFKSLNDETKIFAVTGFPLTKTSNPFLHNELYKRHKKNAIMIPLASTSIEESLAFANELGISGMAITVPYKEKVLPYVQNASDEVKKIEATNTIVKTDAGFFAYNTDAFGFEKALLEFLQTNNLRKTRIAIIGAGGAAKAVAFVIKKLHGNACIFNRTLSKAQELAKKYRFYFAELSPVSLETLQKFSNVIIQTTNVGMNANTESNEETDPIYFYNFRGTEKIFDLIYTPKKTALMKKAENAGCKISNGFTMLRYQAEKQAELFQGIKNE